jgi:prepilin-type processing-associated H-X9-DG protein
MLDQSFDTYGMVKRHRLSWIIGAIAIALFLPARGATQSQADKKCIENLKEIYRLLLYDHHLMGGDVPMPSNFNRIYGLASDANLFICPADTGVTEPAPPNRITTSYEIVNDLYKFDPSNTPPNMVALVVEIRPNHEGKRNVLFGDGSVRSFDQAQYERLKNDSLIDGNSQ